VEPITHVLFGATLGRAGLNRKTAFATATLTLAAEAPDVDILYYFVGPVVGFQHHRGWTHSLIAAPVMAALALGVVWLWNRLFRRKSPTPGAPVSQARARLPARWGLMYLYACLGAASHVLLDFTNSYGVKPIAPLSYHWVAWDIVSIIEPFMLAALVLGLAMPSLFALVGEEIGARRQRFRGRGGAVFALLAIVLMWGFRDYQHRRAVAALESFLYDGSAPIRVAALPYAWNPFLWYGVVETENFFRTMQVDTLKGEVDPGAQAHTYFKPEETPVTLAAKKSYLGQVYLAWSRFPILEVERRETSAPAYIVRFYDLRFQYPGRRSRLLTSSVHLDQNLKVVEMYFGRRSQRPPVD
jgi:inner membrane protein